MRNKFECFTPLMHKREYKFVEKHLVEDDVLFEWGSGNSTLYFSGLVKKVISVEDELRYYKTLKSTIESFKANNIELHFLPGISVKDPKAERHIQFEKYINFPVNNKVEFSKAIIDGRARKYCASAIAEHIKEDTLVFVHDWNRNSVEDYEDEDYHNHILKHYEIFDLEKRGLGIAALKKKKK